MTNNLKTAQKDLESIQANQAEFASKLEQVATDRAAVIEAAEDGADLEALTKQVIELDGRAEILRAALGKSKEQESIALGVVKRLQRQEAEQSFEARRQVICDKACEALEHAEAIEALRIAIDEENTVLESISHKHFINESGRLDGKYRNKIRSSRGMVVNFSQGTNQVIRAAKAFTNGNK